MNSIFRATSRLFFRSTPVASSVGLSHADSPSLAPHTSPAVYPRTPGGRALGVTVDSGRIGTLSVHGRKGQIIGLYPVDHIVTRIGSDISCHIRIYEATMPHFACNLRFDVETHEVHLDALHHSYKRNNIPVSISAMQGPLADGERISVLGHKFTWKYADDVKELTEEMLDMSVPGLRGFRMTIVSSFELQRHRAVNLPEFIAPAHSSKRLHRNTFPRGVESAPLAQSTPARVPRRGYRAPDDTPDSHLGDVSINSATSSVYNSDSSMHFGLTQDGDCYVALEEVDEATEPKDERTPHWVHKKISDRLVRRAGSVFSIKRMGDYVESQARQTPRPSRKLHVLDKTHVKYIPYCPEERKKSPEFDRASPTTPPHSSSYGPDKRLSDGFTVNQVEGPIAISTERSVVLRDQVLPRIENTILTTDDRPSEFVSNQAVVSSLGEGPSRRRRLLSTPARPAHTPSQGLFRTSTPRIASSYYHAPIHPGDTARPVPFHLRPDEQIILMHFDQAAQGWSTNNDQMAEEEDWPMDIDPPELPEAQIVQQVISNPPQQAGPSNSSLIPYMSPSRVQAVQKSRRGWTSTDSMSTNRRQAAQPYPTQITAEQRSKWKKDMLRNLEKKRRKENRKAQADANAQAQAQAQSTVQVEASETLRLEDDIIVAEDILSNSKTDTPLGSVNSDVDHENEIDKGESISSGERDDTLLVCNDPVAAQVAPPTIQVLDPVDTPEPQITSPPQPQITSPPTSLPAANASQGDPVKAAPLDTEMNEMLVSNLEQTTNLQLPEDDAAPTAGPTRRGSKRKVQDSTEPVDVPRATKVSRTAMGRKVKEVVPDVEATTVEAILEQPEADTNGRPTKTLPRTRKNVSKVVSEDSREATQPRCTTRSMTKNSGAAAVVSAGVQGNPASGQVQKLDTVLAPDQVAMGGQQAAAPEDAIPPEYLQLHRRPTRALRKKPRTASNIAQTQPLPVPVVHTRSTRRSKATAEPPVAQPLGDEDGVQEQPSAPGHGTVRQQTVPQKKSAKVTGKRRRAVEDEEPPAKSAESTGKVVVEDRVVNTADELPVPNSSKRRRTSRREPIVVEEPEEKPVRPTRRSRKPSTPAIDAPAQDAEIPSGRRTRSWAARNAGVQEAAVLPDPVPVRKSRTARK
ncbi:hypothetical protein DACRYDRAFT_108047 [Dacryopinax primogenitus]|uniref:FHA domain-containing protein n=1 Tax=Dacryopinax primogenitus (strain DJM 731) TaxID=1858805 RepID=M5G6P8_DACPD|nr:uncharacterized protein DACRYDRAFT_108047 [Dacryopinax primogenitus]EJU01497.1 hypothetical protein DACRYDRAFT_108047 [Dacryopinax primogenitus]